MANTGRVRGLNAFCSLALSVIATLSILAFFAAPAFAVILGNTGATLVDSGDSNFLNGTKVSVGTTNLTVTSMSVFVGNVDTSPNNQYQVAIYADNGGSPGSLVANSGTGILTPNTWNTLAISAALQRNTNYWLMYNANGRNGSVNNMYYSNGNAGQGAYSTAAVPFGTWPTTFGARALTNTLYALYATAGSPSDVIPPTVGITTPVQNAVVSGIATISADAADNAGAPSVQFKVDGINIGALVIAAPYTVQWNSGLTTNGTHTLTAVASDGAGNLTTSSSVTIMVSNIDRRAQLGEWGAVMDWPLIAIHASVLKNGKVLVWDEEVSSTHPKLWDPATAMFIDTGVLNKELWCAGHAQLADGRLLVVGGHLDGAGESGIKATFQYDADANAWTPTTDMKYSRWYPALTKLSDGRVVIVSGQITTGTFANIPEIYVPDTGSSATMAGINTSQLREEEYPADFHLPNGKILAISPQYGPVQLLDASANTWTNVNTTPIIFGSAVQYRPGKILMSGGGPDFLASSVGRTAVLDMSATTPVWRTTPSMSLSRYMHNLVMLPTGKVLAVGGLDAVDEGGGHGPLPAEMWDPATEVWTTVAPLDQPRIYHSTAVLLPDGRVLAAGGGHNAAAPDFFSAQVYSPPYLFKGPRPTITSAPVAVLYGSSAFTVDSPDASNISSVALVALASTTHSTDMNQFYTELQFNKTAGQLSVTAPQSGNEVPPGYYMLFIVDANGVPSTAKIIKIGSSLPPPPPPPPPPPSPTVGLTTVGSTLDSGNSNFLTGSRVTTSSGGNIVSMSVYVSNIDANSANRQYQLAIYTDNAGKPGTLITKTATGALVANSWNTLSIAATLQNNTSYWLMYNTNGRATSVNNLFYNNGATGQGAYSTNRVSFGTWPSTFPSATVIGAVYSLYASFGP